MGVWEDATGLWEEGKDLAKKGLDVVTDLGAAPVKFLYNNWDNPTVDTITSLGAAGLKSGIQGGQAAIEEGQQIYNDYAGSPNESIEDMADRYARNFKRGQSIKQGAEYLAAAPLTFAAETYKNPWDTITSLGAAGVKASPELVDIGKRYIEGAKQSYEEMARTQRQLDEVSDYDGATGKRVPKQGYTQNDVDYAQSQASSAAKTFRQDAVYSVLLPAGIPEGIYDSAKEGGMLKVGRDLTYGPAADLYNDPDLKRKMEENPVATMTNVALAGAQLAAPLGFAKYIRSRVMKDIEVSPEYAAKIDQYGQKYYPDKYNVQSEPQQTNFTSTGDANLDGYIQEASSETGINPNLLKALIDQESSFNPNAESPVGAKGYAQLMPDTARGLGVDINDTRQNVLGGARYLKEQLDKFDGDVDKALAAYNAGPGAVEKYGGVPPYKETQDYVRSIKEKLGEEPAETPISEEKVSPEENIPTEEETTPQAATEGREEDYKPIGADTKLEEQTKEPWEMTKEEHKTTLGYGKWDTSFPREWDLPEDTRYTDTPPEEVTTVELKELDMVKKGDKPAALPNDTEVLENWIREAENRGLYVEKYTNINGNVSAVAAKTQKAARRVLNAKIGSEEMGKSLGAKTHKEYVEQALKEGKPVPKEVIKEYPDLQVENKSEIPEGTPSIPFGEGELGKVERSLADNVNKEIEPVNLPVGMTVKETTKGIVEPAKTVKFSNPEVEARWQEASKGIKKEGIISSVKESTKTFWHRITRVYEDLPNNAEFSQLKNDLLYLEKQKGVSGDRTARLLQGITIKLDKPGMDLFTRKVVLDDLAKTEGDLPFGLTAETLSKDKAIIDKAVKDNPVVAEAVENRRKMQNALKQDYIDAMKNIGYDVSARMSREDYFRHQVLEYANLRAVAGSGERLKTPTGRGFLKGRQGSLEDINANYLQAEFEVVAQMIHDTELARVINKIDKNYSIRNKLFDEFGDKWRENITEGYTTWQPREGSSFYMANTIPESLASKLLSGELEEIGVLPEQIRQVLAKGSPFKELVVKDEVANTLNKISTPTADNLLEKVSRSLLSKWKVWTLISPTRLIKYNLRNVTGDADALFTMNRSSFLKVPQATKELFQTIYGDRAMTPEMGEWFRRGGMETTSPVQELTDVNGLRMFEKFTDKDPNFIKNAWNKYWGTANRATQFREAIFRYSTYLDYLEQMKKNGGRPKNFGASKPEEIMALSDIRDRAFKLSNDVLGAYDNVSVLGKEIRTHLVPFYSFLETNFKRYAQFYANQKVDSWTGLGSAISRKLVGNVLIRSPYYAYAAGTFVVKAGMLWAAVQAYNNLMFPEEEKELPPDEQARFHIVLGRDSNGKVRYFNRLGSVPDFLEWFGLDAPAKDIKDYLDGSRNMKEIMIDWSKNPVNKVIQGASPFIKTPFEMLSGKKLFPDAFNPVSIRDNGQYIADSLGLGNEFKALSKTGAAQYLGVNPRPSKPYLTEDTGENFILYKSDPNQVAYYNIKDKKIDFLKDIGKGGDGDFSSPKSDALRNYKIALRVKDEQSASFYLDLYTKLGGNKKGLQKSLESLDPLAGMSAVDRAKFKNTLNGEQLKELEKANTYYKTVLLGK